MVSANGPVCEPDGLQPLMILVIGPELREELSVCMRKSTDALLQTCPDTPPSRNAIDHRHVAGYEPVPGGWCEWTAGHRRWGGAKKRMEAVFAERDPRVARLSPREEGSHLVDLRPYHPSSAAEYSWDMLERFAPVAFDII